MVKRKTQKGSGLLNRVRTFFRGRKVAPAPSAPKTQTRKINIKDESYMNALRRDYVFFYYKLKGLQPPKEKRFISPEQEAEVRDTLIPLKDKGMEEDEIVRSVFHANPIKFQQELSDWEEYNSSGLLNKGTPYERRAFSVAKSLDRFIGTIKSSPKQLQYKSNFMVHICDSTNFDQPVKTLSDDYCFAVLTPEIRDIYEDNRGSGYATSYIVVKPEFFPPRVTISGGPINLNAMRLSSISFLIDAFRQNGVLDIEPILKETLQREAPELLQFSSKNPIVIATPWYLTDPSVTSGSFIIVDSLQRGRNVVNLKEISKSEVVRDAFSKRKVYFMDPKTMFHIRETLYPLWLANYGTVNTNLYRRLTQNEKLVFCFLQFTKFLELYSLFRDAQPGNTGNITSRKIAKAVQKAKKLVFEADYSAGANPFELLENFTVEDNENWRQLVEIQKEVLGKAIIQTPQDLRTLLSKFTLRKNAIAETVIPNYYGPSTVNLGRNVGKLATRKQRVKQMMESQNIQKQRNILMKQFKNALSKPVKGSILPNFMRTKKAKERNRQAYVNRIETARKAVLEFNREHGQNYYV